MQCPDYLIKSSINSKSFPGAYLVELANPFNPSMRAFHYLPIFIHLRLKSGTEQKCRRLDGEREDERMRGRGWREEGQDGSR